MARAVADPLTAPPERRPEVAAAAAAAHSVELPLPVDLAPLVVATVHPSSILRAGAGRDEAYVAFVRDLRTVAAWLSGR